MDSVAKGLHFFALVQDIEPKIELPLKPVDHGGIEPGKPLLVEQPIKPILTLDQEMQPALSIIDVESEEKFDPGQQLRYRGALALQHLTLGPLVDDAAMDRPGMDNFLDGARERRVQGSTPDLREHAGNELAHRSEFQARIALVGKARVTGDACINLLTPAADFIGREPAVKRLIDNVTDEFIDVRSGPFYDRFDPPDLGVEVDHPRQFVRDRLSGRQVRKRSLQRREKTWQPVMGAGH